MQRISGEPYDGIFQYQTSTLSVGTHCYSFACTDGHTGLAILPDDGIPISGPVVSPINHTPIAINDHAIVRRGGTVSILDTGYSSVLQNDTDPDGQTITVITELTGRPSHGTLSMNANGTFSYTNNGDDSLTDSFTYSISDGHEGTASATVSITILPPGPANPVLTDAAIRPLAGDSHDEFTFSVNYFDADGETPAYSFIMIDSIPFVMRLTDGTASNGTYTFKTFLSEGEHDYSFYFMDASGNECRLPAAGSFSDLFVFEYIERFHVAPEPIGSDSNDGSAEHPFATIAHAIDVAEGTPLNPVIIRIAAGTYRESVDLEPWICLEGGWRTDFSSRLDLPGNSTEQAGDNETIIDGQGSSPCMTIIEVPGVIVEGITMQNGSSSYYGGGALAIKYCSPLISSCRILNSFSPPETCGKGGGMYLSYASPEIKHCVFSGNESALKGGALYSCNSSPVITDCVFTDNHVGAKYAAGGAIYISAGSPVIIGCEFSLNTAGGMSAFGGAIYNEAGTPIFSSCLIRDNSVFGSNQGFGGAFFNLTGNPVITNSTFCNNEAGSLQTGSSIGGAIYNTCPADPVITNCILWGDMAGMNPEIFSKTAVSLTYSDIDQDGFEEDTDRNNMRQDPLFLDVKAINYRLQPGSPCRDTGSVTAPGISDTDLDALPRIIGVTADMGAFEFFEEE